MADFLLMDIFLSELPFIRVCQVSKNCSAGWLVGRLVMSWRRIDMCNFLLLFMLVLDWSVEFEVWSCLIPLPLLGGGRYGDKHYFVYVRQKKHKTINDH
jgi:hypothetical protein